MSEVIHPDKSLLYILLVAITHKKLFLLYKECTYHDYHTLEYECFPNYLPGIRLTVYFVKVKQGLCVLGDSPPLLTHRHHLLVQPAAQDISLSRSSKTVLERRKFNFLHDNSLQVDHET